MTTQISHFQRRKNDSLASFALVMTLACSDVEPSTPDIIGYSECAF